jgi:iron complex outermembrane receptor protein
MMKKTDGCSAMSRRFRALTGCASVALLAGLFAGAAPTAQAETMLADADTNFEAVFVTARKRAEEAQTVPISIDVFDQRSIERLGVQTLEDLRYSAPSLYVAPSTFRQDTINVAIRGQQNFPSTGLQFDTSTAVYADGVYYARAVGLNGALFDVSNVQVLKGPQGTLVGRNSTGGAILYETRQPTSDFNGYVRTTLGNYDRADIQAAVNVPLSDTLFVRGAISSQQQRGYIKNYYSNPATGYTNNKPGMGYRRLTGLLSVKWQPTDDFSLLVRANISDEKYTGVTYHDLGSFTGTAPAAAGRPSICNIPGTCTGFTDLLGNVITPYFSNYLTGNAVSTLPSAYNALLNSVERSKSYGFWSTEQVLTNTNEGEYKTLSAVADKAVGSLDVKLLGAYRWWNNSGMSSGRGLPYVTNIFEYETPKYRSYQGELTVNGAAMDDRLKYTAGLFYFRETSPNDGDKNWLYLPSAGTPAAAPGRQITFTDPGRTSQANTSYAAYTQATYNLRDDTRLTAGLRYTVDKRHAVLATQNLRYPATPTTTASVPNGVFDPTSTTLFGITYSGMTRGCAITNANGRPLPLNECAVTLNRTFKKPTWTLAIDHDLTDGTLVYATARSGYRSGAINSAAINPLVTTAQPERVTDYEIGIKSDWRLGSMPVRTNLSLYRSDYRDLQLQTTLVNATLAIGPNGGVCNQAAFNAGQCLGTTTDSVTLNARRARINGFEASVAIKPVEGLTLDVSGSYLDAKYTDYTFNPPPGYLLTTGRVDLTGQRFPLPKTQLNANAVYETSLQNLGLSFAETLQLSYHAYYQSRFEADLRPYNPVQKTTSYTMSDVRLDLLNIAAKKVDLGLFARNVFNKEACVPEPSGVLNSAPNGTFGVANTSGVLQCVPLPPRTYGMTLSMSF